MDWQPLLSSTSKTGWHIYNNRSDGSAWSVQNGTLHLDPKEKIDRKTVGGGDIVTDQEFDNFHLQLEWKVEKGGNSGVIFYIKEEPRFEQTWHTGLEMQVLDNAVHTDAKIHKHKAGDLYDLISGSPDMVKPAGDWNKVDIIANRGALEFKLNGTSIVKTTLWDEKWKQLVSESKFKQWSEFGTYKSGRIALQDHGDPVWYRNIRIKRL